MKFAVVIIAPEDDVHSHAFDEVAEAMHHGLLELGHESAQLRNEFAGANLLAVFGVYGSKRDELIARARIVLNVHFYESKVFEIVRVSYLLANRRFVISERGADRGEEQPFDGGLVFCDYDDLSARCLYFLQRADEREKMAQRGFDLIRGRQQAEFLALAIPRL